MVQKISFDSQVDTDPAECIEWEVAGRHSNFSFNWRNSSNSSGEIASIRYAGKPPHFLLKQQKVAISIDRYT
jgi:hypothetical protein